MFVVLLYFYFLYKHLWPFSIWFAASLLKINKPNECPNRAVALLAKHAFFANPVSDKDKIDVLSLVALLVLKESNNINNECIT
jgi:hypothetical protein